MKTENISIERKALVQFLDEELKTAMIQDYCPNGLQVEGTSHISTIVSGVTASQALIDRAVELNADALLVHHGYFWRGENAAITGLKRNRIKKLLTHDINLLVYHLPLDLHPVIGNNAQLGKILGLTPSGRFGNQELGWLGMLENPDIETAGQFADHVGKMLGRKPLLVGDPFLQLGTIGWCSGAAQDLIADAISAGATIYLSGEISEQTVHEARENGIVYLACGHHATERYGIQALGNLLAEKFGVRHTFIDIDNPA